MKQQIFEVDAHDYYAKELADPEVNFNSIEITLSHLFRYPNQALSGMNFSEAMFHFLKKEELIGDLNFLEVGGGLGHVAKNLCDVLHNEFNQPVRYTMLDISPKLLFAQQMHLKGYPAEFTLGDATQLPYGKNEWNGTILAVGVLADLRSILVDRKGSFPYDRANSDKIKWYMDKLAQAHPLDSPFYLHVGAMNFIEQINRVLQKGTAILLEYSVTKLNEVSDFGNHLECGINFDHLRTLASLLGFNVALKNIEDILDFDPSTEFLSVDFFTREELLIHKVSSVTTLWTQGRTLPVKAYTRDMLREELSKKEYQLTDHKILQIMKECESLFYSLFDARFDTKHPDTWRYKALILRKD